MADFEQMRIDPATFLKAIGVAEPQPWQLRFLGALRDGQLRSAANASRFSMGLSGPLPLAPVAPPCGALGLPTDHADQLESAHHTLG